jgi:multiple antibiotic resistance protein
VDNPAVAPLAMPLLAGSGVIATPLVVAEQAAGVPMFLLLCSGAALVFGSTYLFFVWADELFSCIGGQGMKIVTRIMGLLLAFIAIQFVVDGIKGAGLW